MEILYITLLTVIASGVGTLSGFGTSTIMVPVLLFFYSLPQTLLLVGIIHWFGDIWKISLFYKKVRWKLILLFTIPGIVATFLGAKIVFSLPEVLLSHILGAFLIVYTLFLFFKPSFKIPKNKTTATLGGLTYGFLAGIFGVGGAVRGAFLIAYDLPKAAYVVTNGLIGLAVDSVRISTYIINGQRLESILLWGLIAFIPASFLGARLAKKIINKISQKYFRAVIAVFILLAGLKLLLFP